MNAGKGCLLGVGAAVTALILGLLFAVALLGDAEASCDPTAGQPGSSQLAHNTIPGNYLTLYHQAGRAYGIGWNLLAGVGKVESDHGRSTEPGVRSGMNFAGAAGPMQFGIGGLAGNTWGSFGVDGDHDGDKDVYDPADAIPAAAGYLKHHGAPGDLRKALFAYNHAGWYVDLVLTWAGRYGSGDLEVGDDNNAACTPGAAPGTGGPFGQRIVAYAKKWLGTPYLWGGGDFHGPTRGCAHGFCGTGFDCSGLALYAVYQASGGKIKLGHYTGNQFSDPHGRKVPRDQLQAGDLVFFKPDLGHMGIFIGDGKFIHAPQTGDVVKISPMSSRSDFAGAVRITPPAGSDR